jgi:adenine deaminase
MKTKDLIDIALGKQKSDLVIKNANLVNVCSGEIYETDIAIARGMIVGLGKYAGREEIEARGKYAVPGLIDGHTHIEMSMLSVGEFAKAVVPRGTTAVVADPHEIANVLGVEGIRAILEEAKTTPLKVFCMAPSCVPSTDPSLGLETSGARIEHEEIKKLLQMEEVIGLAEVMNYSGVITKEDEVWKKIEVAKDLKLPIDGHAPLLSGKELNAYVLSGAGSDHESVSYEEALEKLRLGMRVMVREGSVAKNLKNIAPLLKSIDTGNCIIVTDGDRTPLDLKEEGYLDHVFRRAVEEGVDPVKAVQMCTINPAEWCKLDDFHACSVK